MKQVLVVGEDSLCCALGEQLVAEALPSWKLAASPIDTMGRTNLLSKIVKYAEQAIYVNPVLCVADTDGACAKELAQQWRPRNASPRFQLRLAVTESESWVLADRSAFSEYFCVPVNRLPTMSDTIDDPKRLLLNLVRQSKKRQFRDEMVSELNAAKQGVGYNIHLVNFVRTKWRPAEARRVSTSLDRAINRLGQFDLPPLAAPL